MRRGFVLIEVVAAIALAAFLLTGAVGLLDQLRDATRRITSSQAEQDASSNGLHLLRTTVAQAEPSTDSTKLFAGNAIVARFWSFCDAPGGWPEECAVTLTVVPVGDHFGIEARLTKAEPTLLMIRADSIRFAYLGSNQGSGWTAEWQSSILPPTALGVVTGHDTLVVLAGLPQ